ncbi:MAG: hypothetical protein ACUVRZ_13080, partial [Desulfobacca sp.]|uniref:hypothetical protein n=1 Tax=Desulfobacca sp. TaxID=2067990 RepID=UPI00404B8366
KNMAQCALIMMSLQLRYRGGRLLQKLSTAGRLLLFLLLALAAQIGQAAPAGQQHSAFEYNPQEVLTVTGMITAIQPAAPTKLPEPVFLTLSTPQGKVKVFLGPNWYVAEQGMKFAILDRLEVTGARIVDQGRVIIFAAQVKKGDQIMQIRDETGRPLWTGRKQEAK